MFAYLAQRVGVAVLALAVLFATAPIVAAPAAPCACPSMHAMHMADAHSRTMPMKEHGTPCKQACVCGMSCEAAANMPQTFTAVHDLAAQS